MLRLNKTASAYLSATLLVVAGCQLSALEQGTYFIFQIVDQVEGTKVIDKRLALDSQLFVETETAQVKSAPSTKKSSEFEIDYTSLSLGTAPTSGFGSAFSSGTKRQTTSDSSSFNLNTEETISLFGD
ncbi:MULTISPECIES: hypothetical protein [unclassified Lentimonas]|uniref:hypothetical protein n=1 Tax=unclassified Lentimonas TaxID=2630993 RepID=UPI0013214A04|nr:MULTISPECIES: hypothetical protein [unclassified Lentimonas]CAA6694116.1 Unannotated [Lentimonas sp. CC19]CAA6694385.1 Unannotated [Lentimonas sp. CC10]CAA7070349.1 Unannotated [Lentimonas sp. CC11]